MKKLILLITIITVFISCKKTDVKPLSPRITPEILHPTGASTGSSSSSENTGSNCQSVRCIGTTQSGNQCQRMTTNCNRRCWQHQ
jgi:hypothetical protein